MEHEAETIKQLEGQLVHAVSDATGFRWRAEDCEKENIKMAARIHRLEEALANVLQAQARFVPCSERLPKAPGAYIAAVTAQAGHLFLKVMLYDREWVSADPVVSWLDNLPSLDGSVRIKGE